MLNIITVRHNRQFVNIYGEKRRLCIARRNPKSAIVPAASRAVSSRLTSVVRVAALMVTAVCVAAVAPARGGARYADVTFKYQGNSGPYYMYNGTVPGVPTTQWLDGPSWIGHQIDSWVEEGNWYLTTPTVTCEYGDPEYLFRSIRIHNVWHDNKEWGKMWFMYNITSAEGQWECYEAGRCTAVGSGPLANHGKMSPYLGLTLHPVPEESDRFKCIVTYEAVANSKWQSGIAVTSTVEVTYDPIVTAEIDLKPNYDCKTSGMLCTTRVPLVVVTRPRGVKLSGRLKIDGARNDNVTIRGKGGVEQRIPAYMTLIPYDESYIDVNVSRGEDDSQLGERTINLNLTWESI